MTLPIFTVKRKPADARGREINKNPKISILILTHNAPEYVQETLETLRTTITDDKTSYEVIVVDNASEEPTREILRRELAAGAIDQLKMSEKNLLFAGGNNLAATLVSASSRYFLLLNADVSIRSPFWLKELMLRKENGGYGATSFGVVYDIVRRCDGYCYLIDRDLYEKYPLDEDFPWWWGVTKQEGEILRSGKTLLAIANHDSFIVHYGGKSGSVSSCNGAFGAQADVEEIKKWFASCSADVLDYKTAGIIEKERRQHDTEQKQLDATMQRMEKISMKYRKYRNLFKITLFIAIFLLVVLLFLMWLMKR